MATPNNTVPHRGAGFSKLENTNFFISFFSFKSESRRSGGSGEGPQSINLFHGGVGDKQDGKYSERMKMRLSVAISLIGDSKVCINLHTIYDFILLCKFFWNISFFPYSFCGMIIGIFVRFITWMSQVQIRSNFKRKLMECCQTCKVGLSWAIILTSTLSFSPSLYLDLHQ